MSDGAIIGTTIAALCHRGKSKVRMKPEWLGLTGGGVAATGIAPSPFRPMIGAADRPSPRVRRGTKPGIVLLGRSGTFRCRTGAAGPHRDEAGRAGR